MARKTSSPSPSPELPPRPWWISPPFPLALLIAGLVLCSLDGLHPYRTALRRRSWKPVEGQLLQPYERRQVTNPTSEGTVVREYLERRPQKRIFQETVTEGWPIERRKVQWKVRLNYTYPWGNTRHTKVGDGPERTFDTEEAAHAYLSRRLRGTAITVRVNPKAPSEATAFLEYRRIWNLRVGLTASGLGLIWFLVALGLTLSHARRERKHAARVSSSGENSPENPSF